MRAITIRGPFHGASGHSHHVREFVRELNRRGICIELRDVPGWRSSPLPETGREEWFGSLTRPHDSEIAVHFCMPHQVIRVPGKLNVNFTMFEATRVPPSWVAEGRRQDLLIVPTRSSEEAWVRSGMPPHRIRLCPLGVDPGLFAQEHAPLPLTTADGQPAARYRTRFLNVSQIGPRKNISGLLQAWIEATSATDNAVLILKTDSAAAYRREAACAESEAGKRLIAAAPVIHLQQTFGAAEMPRLYAAATHYFSMSHGEGWDLPMMEAAASGLTPIAPDHSAYRTYLDDSVATMIPSREVPADYAGDPETAALFEGANWWAPDHQEAVAAVRAAIRGDGPCRASARQRVLSEFTWEAATDRLIQILGELQPMADKLRLVAAFRASRKTAEE
jgi:glycosyltransferase involved in cell wall biosynthesis